MCNGSCRMYDIMYADPRLLSWPKTVSFSLKLMHFRYASLCVPNKSLHSSSVFVRLMMSARLCICVVFRSFYFEQDVSGLGSLSQFCILNILQFIQDAYEQRLSAPIWNGCFLVGWILFFDYMCALLLVGFTWNEYSFKVTHNRICNRITWTIRSSTIGFHLKREKVEKNPHSSRRQMTWKLFDSFYAHVIIYSTTKISSVETLRNDRHIANFELFKQIEDFAVLLPSKSNA